MKDSIKFIGLLITVFTIIVSCSQDPATDDFKSNNYSIKSIFADGKTRQKFIYNEIGKIVENQSFYFCSKYIYDNNDRLIKQN
jgi:hypothetical protein